MPEMGEGKYPVVRTDQLYLDQENLDIILERVAANILGLGVGDYLAIDRVYLDRTNQDSYLYRVSATHLGLSGGLKLGNTLHMNSNKITNLLDPTANQDGDTKLARDTAISTHAADYGLHTKVVRKTADETVNNSTTLQNDDHLLLAMAANEVWLFFFWLTYNSASPPDIKFAITVPSGGTLEVAPVDDIGQLTNTTPITPVVAAGSFALAGAASDRVCLVWALYKGGSNAGNVQLQFAQNSAQALDTTLKANSCLVATKIA